MAGSSEQREIVIRTSIAFLLYCPITNEVPALVNAHGKPITVVGTGAGLTKFEMVPPPRERRPRLTIFPPREKFCVETQSYEYVTTAVVVVMAIWPTRPLKEPMSWPLEKLSGVFQSCFGFGTREK